MFGGNVYCEEISASCFEFHIADEKKVNVGLALANDVA